MSRARKKIAVFLSHYTIGNSPSIINFIECLSDHYQVDMYMRSVGLRHAGILRKRNVAPHYFQRRRSFSYFHARAKSLLAQYHRCVCFDPHGFALCKHFFPNSSPIYYSLELYMRNDHHGLHYPQELMESERSQINSICGLIIQSREKELLFRQDYGLSPDIPTLLMPVTYKGRSSEVRSSMIREAYDIGAERKVALHLGEITGWHSCIEIALEFSELRNWVLLFQGYHNPEYVARMERTLRENGIDNVLVSARVYDSLDGIDQVIQSCDVGIAWYNDISVGFRTAGKSSGKIPAYLRFGLPVIAKKYPSTVEAIEAPGCGICVDDFAEIGPALSRIEGNYAAHSDAARAEYDRTYRFELYESKIIEFIENQAALT